MSDPTTFPITPNVFCHNPRCGQPLASRSRSPRQPGKPLQFTVRTYDGTLIWEMEDGRTRKSHREPRGADSATVRLIRWNSRFKVDAPPNEDLRSLAERSSEVNALAEEYFKARSTGQHDRADEIGRRLGEDSPPRISSLLHFLESRQFIAKERGLAEGAFEHIPKAEEAHVSVATLLYGGFTGLFEGQRVRCPKCKWTQCLR